MITCLRPPTSMRSFCCHDLWLPRTHGPHPAVAPKGRGQVHSEKEDVAGALGSGTVALRFGGESWGLTAQPGPPPTNRSLILGVPPQKNKSVPCHPGGARAGPALCCCLFTCLFREGATSGPDGLELSGPPLTQGLQPRCAMGGRPQSQLLPSGGSVPSKRSREAAELYCRSGVEMGVRQGARAAALCTNTSPEPQGASLVSAGRHPLTSVRQETGQKWPQQPDSASPEPGTPRPLEQGVPGTCHRAQG